MIDTKTNRKELYRTLTQLDIIGKLKPILLNENYSIRPDGRWVRNHSMQWNTPWVHQYNERATECELWHRLFFNYFKKVPTYCQDCWKVVVMPRNVVELFSLYEIQKRLRRPCKCGCEMRATDDRLYGGYFYNWGQAAGQECYEEVRKAVDREISPDVNVILKCACTEYEIECGPPADWKADENQLFIEEAIKKWVMPGDWNWTQPDYLVAYVMLSWIHRAAMTGDSTYKQLTNGEDITFKAKTYHKEIKNGEMEQ